MWAAEGAWGAREGTTVVAARALLGLPVSAAEVADGAREDSAAVAARPLLALWTAAGPTAGLASP